jgi:hypothetical protein
MNKNLTTKDSEQHQAPRFWVGAVISRFFCSRIIGHKVDLSKTDSGYLYCQRCGSHEYYDNDFNVFALFLLPLYIRRYINIKISDYKYNRDKNNQLPF